MNRKSTARGQMTRGANSGPAVMLMPPHIRATFMPNPPLKHLPPVVKRRKQLWLGISQYVANFEKETSSERKIVDTPKLIKESNKKKKKQQHLDDLEPLVEEYRKKQKECSGEFLGMNCYNTLFVGRLAYEVTERKLLREMEAFGPVKDLRIITDKEGKSRGYTFVEYEHEDDMKRAYRAADGMKIEGREIVVDVERGHTVPSWLPRRLGGGLGGTRLGGKDVNVTRPGRFDPSRPDIVMPVAPPSMGRGAGPLGPPPMYDSGPPRGRGVGFRGPPSSLPPPLPHPPMGHGRDPYGAPPPRDWDHGRYGGGDYNRKRTRSPTPPDRRYGGGRRRY